MKTILKITIFTAILLIFAGILVSCEDKEYPIEISFTEYSLVGTACQWTNLSYDEKIIVINSNNELRNYINCSDGDVPPIDFLKYTLLIATGMGSGAICAIPTAFLQKSKNRYTLEIEVGIGLATAFIRWEASALVPKISNNIHIALVVQETTSSICKHLFE